MYMYVGQAELILPAVQRPGDDLFLVPKNYSQIRQVELKHRRGGGASSEPDEHPAYTPLTVSTCSKIPNHMITFFWPSWCKAILWPPGRQANRVREVRKCNLHSWKDLSGFFHQHTYLEPLKVF
jgi:hypothetical protein